MGKLFVCAECGIIVSRQLELLEDSTALKMGDGQPAVPQGRYALGPEAWREWKGWYLVNLADAVRTRPHPELKRSTGCCGPSGMDGKNTLCDRGHEIGTESSDCWTAHVLALDPLAVLLKDRAEVREDAC